MIRGCSATYIKEMVKCIIAKAREVKRANSRRPMPFISRIRSMNGSKKNNPKDIKNLVIYLTLTISLLCRIQFEIFVNLTAYH